MSAGDTVCMGWLVKSPPERKLQRYVSRGSRPAPSGGPGPFRPRGIPGILPTPDAPAAGEAGGRQSEIARRGGERRPRSRCGTSRKSVPVSGAAAAMGREPHPSA